jgi:hypothetical protein
VLQNIIWESSVNTSVDVDILSSADMTKKIYPGQRDKYMKWSDVIKINIGMSLFIYIFDPPKWCIPNIAADLKRMQGFALQFC